MAGGYSLAAFAGKVGVSRDTVYEWAKSKPEFSDALAKAKSARTLYWEDRLLTATSDSRSVIFALRNACADEWKNEPELSVTVNNELSVTQGRDMEDMTQPEIEAELAKRGALNEIKGNGHLPKRGKEVVR